MIRPTECFYVECDNCKDMFQHPQTGFTIFGDEEQANECIDGYWLHDPKDEAKVYCEKCAKISDEEDDVIIIDQSRRKI